MWLAASCVSASFSISVQRWEFLSSVCLKKFIIVLGFTINFIKQTGIYEGQSFLILTKVNSSFVSIQKDTAHSVLAYHIPDIHQHSLIAELGHVSRLNSHYLMQFWIPTYGAEPPSSAVTSALHLSWYGECFSKQFINTSSRHGIMLAFIWNNGIMNLINIKVQYSLSFSLHFVFQQLLRQIWVLRCSILCSQARC